MIFEAVPSLGEDLRLPIWAFSARAKNTAGRAPAVVSLSQPKVKSDAMELSPGEAITSCLSVCTQVDPTGSL